MNYASIREIDTDNCIGIGVSIFVSGCRNHCKGCFNQETWDFNFGNKFTDKEMKKILELVRPKYIDSFSVLGGDPFEEENQTGVLSIIQEVKTLRPDIKLYIWSGYLYENLLKQPIAREILSICDYLIDGRFEMCNRNLSLRLRGSTNQRVIDLKKSSEDNVVLWKKAYDF